MESYGSKYSYDAWNEPFEYFRLLRESKEMRVLGERFVRQVICQVEPYLTSKNTVDKINYLENLLGFGEKFSASLYREGDTRKKLLNSLQLVVVVVILRRLVELLENSIPAEEACFSEKLVERSSGDVEDLGVIMGRFHTLKHRFRKLQETLPPNSFSFSPPLAEETVEYSIFRTASVNSNTERVKYDTYRNYLSFLQLPEPQASNLLISARKVEDKSTQSLLIRKRRGEKASDDDSTHRTRDRNEILTTELLSLTEQLKSGSEAVYEALNRDQERLGKLAEVVDSNLLHTDKQLKMTEQFGVQSRKTKWLVWIIISLLPVLWMFVYLTIRFH